MKIIISLLISAALVSLTCAADCEPFGIRINYGRNIMDPGNPERLGIRFNTHDQCSNIQLITNKFMIVHCPVQRHSYFMPDNQTNLTTHIHTCSLTRQLEYDRDVEYNLFNVAEAKRVLSDNIKIHIRNPLASGKSFNFLHLADWGPINHEGQGTRLNDISAHLTALINGQKIDAAIINGDIGYELNSNEEHHKLTMQLIQTVSARVPVIMNRGNHEIDEEHNSVGTMFSDYFELYDLDIHNATGITVGSVFLAIVDPFNLLFPRKYHQFTEQSLYSSVTSLKRILEKAKTQRKTVVGLSHYPLVCGFPTPGHCIPDQQRNEFLPLFVNLKDIDTLMLKYHIPLMLSGHVHTYERSYPFIAGYRSKNREKSSYIFDEKDPFYIQVVEGVSGSKDGIHDRYANGDQAYDVPDFVASHSLNCTGFGILSASEDSLRYEHFSVSITNEPQITDRFTIKLPQNSKSSSVGSEL